ncbi:MAG TPA: carboxylating nicotinate-nucleotide diphosphorylase [Polyangiaceae bacterium]|nr:carboxylating nicotinate-nucleotide diphosphorylase [Polyangiaceae bacterium]
MLSPALLDPIIDRALAEDLAGGDLTSELTVDADTRARAVAVARTNLIVCGGSVFARVFERVDPSVSVTLHEPEGTRVESGRELWSVQGPARSLLSAERTALNFVQRMSGIATHARTYVEALPPGSSTIITDTRKTTPGLRVLERYAVRIGGAHSHRDNLGSAVLIKDNHVVAAGGIRQAVERARKGAPHTSRIEVEVQNSDELEIALEAKADIILLDNFPLDALAAAVRRASGRAILEASGGITLQSIGKVASTGVDVISVGALTHSAPAADIALDLDLIS